MQNMYNPKGKMYMHLSLKHIYMGKKTPKHMKIGKFYVTTQVCYFQKVFPQYTAVLFNIWSNLNYTELVVMVRKDPNRY